MSTGSNPNVQALSDALDQVDTATTAAGTAVTAVAAKVQALLDQIAQGATPAQLQAAASRVQGDVSKLNDVATALNGMASDPTTPVPTPVPVVTPA
jgi:ubiquinone biosynthesis protein UbiJ